MYAVGCSVVGELAKGVLKQEKVTSLSNFWVHLSVCLLLLLFTNPVYHTLTVCCLLAAMYSPECYNKQMELYTDNSPFKRSLCSQRSLNQLTETGRSVAFAAIKDTSTEKIRFSATFPVENIPKVCRHVQLSGEI